MQSVEEGGRLRDTQRSASTLSNYEMFCVFMNIGKFAEYYFSGKRKKYLPKYIFVAWSVGIVVFSGCSSVVYRSDVYTISSGSSPLLV